ncbi:alpha/beta hydrolase fold domain-containing protein [Streptomyces ureilyticus]|uniref:Alpha/beta hydrolase n=1 Tax=Streptomyces ureilyticus TaxID=1775131 RepID=A0ABX0DWE9_9ACTN|nr:alpha/beta hydrolase fold domain-containing protein [Streptomyces ureilyticus]NGO43367.1 alpha/beta hydrolase [Streptomyces ureilyticus]
MNADSTTAIERPGRLGDHTRNLRTDPRTDPRVVEALTPFGLDDNIEPAPFGPDAPREQLLEFVMAAEAETEGLLAALVDGLEPIAGLDHRTETITGPAGNDIQLYVTRPADSSAPPLPGILYLHGGGMVMCKGSGPIYARSQDELAATGLVVIGVEFRNGGGELGAHPFPAGLDDCAAALDWVHEHRTALGISTLTVAGESGGGNLALATAIRAKREGRLAAVDGVYALAPYISGLYGGSAEEREAALPSLVENDGYFMACDGSAIFAEVYDPGAEHATDPLCWPCHATVEDLSGLPPHAISVNELDPLRDEGLVYHRRLVEAGVEATSRTVAGTCHGGDLMLRAATPDMYDATVESVHHFAAGL